MASRWSRWARDLRPKRQSKGSAVAFVAVLEGQQPRGELREAGEVLRRDHPALDDGEEDLDLVQPAGVDRQVHQAGGGQVRLIRSTACGPWWEEPLSTIQNTRAAPLRAGWSSPARPARR